jgi:hypothetical protein
MPAMRTPAGTWRRLLIVLSAAALVSMPPVVFGPETVAFSSAPVHSTTPVLDVDPACGSACPERK